MEKLVTKEKMYQWLQSNPVDTIGRGLVAILSRQTGEEQQCRSTRFDNGRGFSKPDANVGTRCANYYLQHKSLLPWMIKVWNPRIAKYWKQLNEIANAKNLHTQEAR